MLFRSAVDVLLQPNGLPAPFHRRFEPQQRGQLVAVRHVGANAFFDKTGETLVEFLELLRILRLGIEKLQKALGDELIELLHQGTVLHRLTRNVQRQIFTVDHAFEESQPLRQQSLRFGIDEHFFAVERHASIDGS